MIILESWHFIALYIKCLNEYEIHNYLQLTLKKLHNVERSILTRLRMISAQTLTGRHSSSRPPVPWDKHVFMIFMYTVFIENEIFYISLVMIIINYNTVTYFM
jgi:hypothetical protein